MDPSPRIDDLFSRLAQQRVLVIGDVMLDWFIWGGVNRISPEAPVPVVEVQRESRYPGGAANVARNLAALIGEVELAGVYGEDANGTLLEETLAEHAIGMDLCCRIPDFTTISKTRVIARQQQVVRIDREKWYELSEDVASALLSKVQSALPHLNGIIIEDYGKGLLSPAFYERLKETVAEFQGPITVDPKPSNPIPWSGVTTMKPNRSEAFDCAGVADRHRDEGLDPMADGPLLEVGEILLERWGCQHVLLTLGEQGMMMFQRSQPPFHIPAYAREVFDVSGAGDTVIAVYTAAIAAGESPVDAAQLANRASSLVVEKLGTVPIEKEELMRALLADQSQ